MRTTPLKFWDVIFSIFHNSLLTTNLYRLYFYDFQDGTTFKIGTLRRQSLNILNVIIS